MRWISYSLLFAALSLGVNGCRASFQDIQKQNLVSSGDNLGAKDGDATPNEGPILENTKELPADESSSYGCDGTVVIHEKGRDKNKDGVLQPTEVTDISTECRPKSTNPSGGKDPTPPPPGGGKDPTPPAQCPNQSDKSKCPDVPSQNPGQNTPTQSGKN